MTIMKKLILSLILSLLFLFNFIFVGETFAYDKKSLVERFTNASCAPCATLNNAWYNVTTQSLINSGSISHIVYNVNWPGPNDPMYLLNSTDNMARRTYYGVSWVPWPIINSVYFDYETLGQTQFVNTVNAGNAEYAPFNIVISQGTISNNLIEVGVKIIRDPNDVTTFGNVKLRVALTEKTIDFGSPPGSNGESEFYSVCRKMMPNAGGTSFTIPAPGDSIMISLQYSPTAEFLQAVNMDSMRVVAFIQDDNTKEIYQSNMHNLNQNYMATISTTDEYHFGASSETAEYTAYVKNIGLFPDTYNITLDFEGPGGWSQSFTTVNGTFNLGQADTVTVNPGDSTSILVSVNGNSINGYGKTYAQFNSVQGTFGITEFKFTTFGLDILVVDDDGGMNYEEYIIHELNTLGSEYGVIPSDFIPSNTNSLNTFNTFVWNTALTEPGVDTDEMNSLKTFLDNGGNLYLNGVDLAYQMADPASPFYSTETNNFFTNYLHSSYILREHTAIITLGIDGDPITDSLGMMLLAGGTGANTINHSAGHYVNQIEAEGLYNANILSFWQKPDDHPAIRAFHGLHGKIVFTAFGFETIAVDGIRALFAERIIDWLSIPVGIEETDPTMMPASFNLSQNYPNPFNPSTKITYALPNQSSVVIKIYDLTGQEVITLVDEVKEAGTYEINFDALNFSSGVYFYQMRAGDFSSVKKMSILK
jgi:hypothetical protein